MISTSHASHASAADLRRRDAIFEALRLAGEIFLRAPSLEAAAPEVMARLGTAAGVSRAYIGQVFPERDGSYQLRLFHEWFAPGIIPLVELHDIEGNIAGLGLARWEQILSRGEVLCGCVDDFPELEQLILRRHGSLSVALVPIFNGERWWGVIGFTDCAEARSWTKAEIEALRSAAGLISAAVQRSEDKAALAASEERYRTLLSNLPGVVYRATPGQPWGTTYISESIAQLSGYPASDFVGRPARSVHSIIHPYDLATIEAQGLTEQPTFEIEYRILHANGSMRWVCDRGQHAYDSAGRVLHIDGFMVDITQRKQVDEQLRALTTQLEQRVIARTAEISTVNERLRRSITALEHSREALVLSEAHYRTLLDASPDAILAFDTSGQLTLVNRPAGRLLGASSGALIGQPWHLLLSPGDRDASDALLARVRQMAQPGTPVIAELVLARPNGTGLPVEVNIAGISAGDELRGYIAVIRDITERIRHRETLTEAYTRVKALNEDIQRSRDLLRTLFDGLDDGMLLLDAAGHVLASNQALASLIGRNDMSLATLNWPALCRTIGLQGEHWPRQAIQQGAMFQERLRLERPGASPRIVDIRTLPLARHPRSTGQVIVQLMDVTERISLERRALESERFAASGRLAAAVAHEINTPLQAVQAFLYLIEHAAPSQRQSYLALTQQEIDRIARIVRQLLDLHRADTDQPALVDLNSTIERVRLLIDHAVSQKRVQLSATYDPFLPPIWGRADQLTQVLINLLMNAVQATPSGGQIQVRTMVAEHDPALRGRVAVISVIDSGPGIPADQIAQVFEPFFTTKPEGTGLGLAISSQIISEHRGRISVESEVGRGSAFTIRLPLSMPEPHHEEPSHECKHPAG